MKNYQSVTPAKRYSYDTAVQPRKDSLPYHPRNEIDLPSEFKE
jgi:hypothetical protein